MGPQQVPQLQVSHNFAMWLLAAIKQKKIFLLDFDFIEALKAPWSLKKKGPLYILGRRLRSFVINRMPQHYYFMGFW